MKFDVTLSLIISEIRMQRNDLIRELYEKEIYKFDTVFAKVTCGTVTLTLYFTYGISLIG